MTQIRCYETTGRPVFITVVLHRRIPYLKNLVGQVAPQALPDAYETTKFLFQSDWTLAARGAAHMKLRQNGTVSFLIRLADFQARGVALMKLHEI